MNRALRFWPAHPALGAIAAVAIAVALTAALSAAHTRGADGGGAPQPPGSQYDRYFSHEQLRIVQRIAMCEALLNLTSPADEMERVKARLAIEEAYIRGVSGAISGGGRGAGNVGNRPAGVIGSNNRASSVIGSNSSGAPSIIGNNRAPSVIGSSSSAPGEWEYRRRPRDKYEIAQAIRLADERHAQTNCR